ncbi:MAG: Uma2 family endonuclease [Eubacteriaceae bacterium]|nr:Uma2 family endonuclease [Eubacteriaceae bacterium]
MDLVRLKEKKKELGYTNQKVSIISGVPLSTVEKVFGNTTSKPRLETYLALLRAIDPMAEYRESGTAYVREAEAARDLYKLEPDVGKYTIDDYYAIPDDRRVELIDGEIYDMGAPTLVHQLIAGEIYRQLSNCAEEHGMECIPMIAPVDVQLDKDDKTMVQPDVLIICDTGMIRNQVVYGAPEFVLEVISPSTRKKDNIVKLNKYCGAGCREYWLVDPANRKVLVYDFGSDLWAYNYTFDDVVPVAISDGKCSIDFTKVSRRIEKISLSGTSDSDE